MTSKTEEAEQYVAKEGFTDEMDIDYLKQAFIAGYDYHASQSGWVDKEKAIKQILESDLDEFMMMQNIREVLYPPQGD